MKKKIRIITVIVLMSIAVIAYEYISTRSRVSTRGVVDSTILKETRNFTVYLPPGYHAFSSRNRTYPILYLFHGFSDNHLGWVRHGELRKTADEMIENGKVPPMIIVVPHTMGGFYGNRADGSYSYEDYFFKEFIPYIEKKYRVKKEKESRAIAGVSMGGNGALLYAMKYPEMFASCSTMGAAVNFNEQPIGIDSLPNENDIEYLLQQTALKRKEADAETLRKIMVRFHIDCGKEDGLYRTNEKLDAIMTELGIPHEFQERTGNHDWDCWRSALPDTLEFVSRTFPN